MKDSWSSNFSNMSFKKWNNLFTFTGLPYCCFQHLVSRRILKSEEWWFVALHAVLSWNQVFFWLNQAVVKTCFYCLQVRSFVGSQIPAMTIAQQEKFNYAIFSFPGRNGISPSLTVLSNWGYAQTTFSWTLRVHRKCQYERRVSVNCGLILSSNLCSLSISFCVNPSIYQYAQ